MTLGEVVSKGVELLCGREECWKEDEAVIDSSGAWQRRRGKEGQQEGKTSLMEFEL